MDLLESVSNGSGNDCRAQLIDEVQSAYVHQTPVFIVGGNSRQFISGKVTEPSQTLSLAGHHGVVSYEPTELVITARTGTRVDAIEALLRDAGQMLPFEPPRFAPESTLGGVVASGLSGPARPYAGSVRDHVLGVDCINGMGQALAFGGQVMKNVAGYDLSRLMTGAWGSLGVLTQVSIKVLPVPETVQTQQLSLSVEDAIDTCNTLAATSVPITAAAHVNGVLHLRLSGSASGVSHAVSVIGGDTMGDDETFWQQLRDWELPSQVGESVWRLSVPSTTPHFTGLTGHTIVDWGGAQRWLVPDANITPQEIHQAATQAGGHATQVRGAISAAFAQPVEPLRVFHERLKDAFDPARIFNPNRFLAGL